jgi:hypothetical protein
MRQQLLPPLFEPDKNSFVTNLDTYQQKADNYGWLPLRFTNDGKRINTVYLTKQGFTVYADFDTKTERLISTIDRR